MPYDRLLSLGALCEPAVQIRRYTGAQASGLFDWIETSWDGLITCFEGDFADFFQLANLRPCRGDHAVADLATNFTFMHLFGETGDRKVSADIIARDYKRVSRSLRFLVRGFQEILDQERALLVRVGYAPDETIYRMWEALDRAHPAGRFELLVINKGEVKTKIDHPRIHVDSVLQLPPGPNSWMGDDRSWDAAFARYAPDNGNAVFKRVGTDERHYLTARIATNLKKTMAASASLPAGDKINVRAGEVIVAKRFESVQGGHARLGGIEIDGKPLDADWFLWVDHWSIS